MYSITIAPPEYTQSDLTIGQPFPFEGILARDLFHYLLKHNLTVPDRSTVTLGGWQDEGILYHETSIVLTWDRRDPYRASLEAFARDLGYAWGQKSVLLTHIDPDLEVQPTGESLLIEFGPNGYGGLETADVAREVGEELAHSLDGWTFDLRAIPATAASLTIVSPEGEAANEPTLALVKRTLEQHGAYIIGTWRDPASVTFIDCTEA